MTGANIHLCPGRKGLAKVVSGHLGWLGSDGSNLGREVLYFCVSPSPLTGSRRSDGSSPQVLIYFWKASLSESQHVKHQTHHVGILRLRGKFLCFLVWERVMKNRILLWDCASGLFMKRGFSEAWTVPVAQCGTQLIRGGAKTGLQLGVFLY